MTAMSAICHDCRLNNLPCTNGLQMGLGDGHQLRPPAPFDRPWQISHITECPIHKGLAIPFSPTQQNHKPCCLNHKPCRSSTHLQEVLPGDTAGCQVRPDTAEAAQQVLQRPAVGHRQAMGMAGEGHQPQHTP